MNQSIFARSSALLSPTEMIQTEKVRALLNERLTAAAEEIFTIFEQTIKEYEEMFIRSKQEIDHQRRTGEWKASLQVSVHEDDILVDQGHYDKTDLCCDDQSRHIKEEQTEDLWTSPADEKQEEAETKDSMFNIIYVQKSEEDRNFMHQNQEAEDKGDHMAGSVSEKLRSDKECCDHPELKSDCQTSAVSDDEWRDSGELHSGINERNPQAVGETAERPHTCSVCNKTFRIKSILTRHMKTHTGEKPYSCSICSKSFIQRSYLQSHMNSHSGQKPHTCKFCGKRFTQVGNMNTHMRIHSGEKPHSCPVCGKSFREKADLIKHKIIHTGEKPYVCSVCNMKFSAQSNLIRHMKTHSGERPHSCTVCGKRFVRRSHLIIHTKTHTRENL